MMIVSESLGNTDMVYPGATETLKKTGCKMVTKKILVVAYGGFKKLVLGMALPSKHQHIIIKPQGYNGSYM